MLLVPRVLQLPKPPESLKRALGGLRRKTVYRIIEFRLDGLRVSEKRHVKMHGLGLKKVTIRTVFCSDP